MRYSTTHSTNMHSRKHMHYGDASVSFLLHICIYIHIYVNILTMIILGGMLIGALHFLYLSLFSTLHTKSVCLRAREGADRGSDQTDNFVQNGLMLSISVSPEPKSSFGFSRMPLFAVRSATSGTFKRWGQEHRDRGIDQ